MNTSFVLCMSVTKLDPCMYVHVCSVYVCYAENILLYQLFFNSVSFHLMSTILTQVLGWHDLLCIQ